MQLNRLMSCSMVLGVLVTLGALSGCTTESSTGKTESTGDGNFTKVNPVANNGDISSPFDATPDPDGRTVYFTAVGPDGPGVFKVPITGGNIEKLAAGKPFVAPFSLAISPDGRTLYVADVSYEDANGDNTGIVFSLPVAGGTPTAMSGTEGFAAHGIETMADKVYLSGTAKDGSVGVFTMGLAGGGLSPLATGDMFSEPSGLTIARNGDVYVVDSASRETSTARVVKIEAGQPKVILRGLSVGYPAGIVLVQNESALLVSALDKTKATDQVIRVELPTLQQKFISDGIGQFVDAAGLHRAKNVDVYAWADLSANSTGTVYVLSK